MLNKVVRNPLIWLTCALCTLYMMSPIGAFLTNATKLELSAVLMLCTGLIVWWLLNFHHFLEWLSRLK
jgi:hypothetical protein